MNEIKMGQPGHRTGGPKRKLKKSSCIIAAVVIILVLALCIGGGYYLYATQPENLPEAVTITIPEGAGLNQITELLQEQNVIRSGFAFAMYVKQQDAATELRPGKYTFGPGEMEFADLLQQLLRGGIAENTTNITIPEGLTVEQTAEVLEKQGVVTKEEFLDYAANLDIPYDYIPQGEDYNQLEGFLFPETYNILNIWGAEEIIDMMLEQFDQEFTQEYRERAEELGMDIYEVVTLASIIEREALYDSDRPIISGVFHNRLDIDMRLQSCATVQYVLGENKPVLTNADTSIDDPYNTYQYDGLPPGPIASPGRTSIEAALYPEETDYLYFLAMPDGHHYFSKTLEEHNAAKEKYLD